MATVGPCPRPAITTNRPRANQDGIVELETIYPGRWYRGFDERLVMTSSAEADGVLALLTFNVRRA
jgi:hypothetical protein